MKFMILFGVLVVSSFWSKMWWVTLSNALLMSSATAIVLSGGFLLLNPVVIVLLIEWRAVFLSEETEARLVWMMFLGWGPYSALVWVWFLHFSRLEELCFYLGSDWRVLSHTVLLLVRGVKVMYVDVIRSCWKVRVAVLDCSLNLDAA